MLVVGSGGREHALVKLIRASSIEPRVYVVMDYANPGLKREAEESRGSWFVASTTKPGNVVGIAELVNPDLIVVGPEEPQFAGVTDALREKGFTVFGADSDCAEIEKSKVFARSLMWKYNIPGRLFFKAFKSLDEASKFIEFAGDVVVKPARQAGGKGVKVLRDTKAYLSVDKSRVKRTYIDKLYDMMRSYSDIEYKILVEQRVEGVEYTAQVITDGETLLPLPLAQDNPHAYEFDIGPETGGMGSIMGPGYLLPMITESEFKKTIEIVESSLKALQAEKKKPYVGAIAGQMMLTGLWGPTVIEFYSRFGDPEIANLVPLLDSDFLEVLERAATRRLAGAKIRVKDGLVSVVKAVAPSGYPDDREAATGHAVVVDERRISELGCITLYASVEEIDGRVYTKGSRVVEIVCSGESYREAYTKSEKAVLNVSSLDGWPLFHRSDVGSPRVIEERARLAERVRRVYLSRAARGLLGRQLVWLPGEGVIENPLVTGVKRDRGGGVFAP
ncbi:MAG: phosphoribosylamine--glycine ligase [Acidilobaceae archaeon]